MEVNEQDRKEGSGDGGVLEGGAEVRVLVVDDSPVERRMVEVLLKKTWAKFQVIAVDSGKKAMEVLGLTEDNIDKPMTDDQKIDVILTDYCMPEMTGYDLLKAVKEQSCRKPIPVVIMSSENEPQRISRCRAIGAEDFILKPLRSTDILRLRDYAQSAIFKPVTGTKRKIALELIADSSNSERRPRLAPSRLAGLAVA